MKSETSVADNTAQDGAISLLPLRREVVMSSCALLLILLFTGNKVAYNLTFEQVKNSEVIRRGIAELMWALGSLVAK
jgi:hypothetical protein